jgi:hypothetical protein
LQGIFVGARLLPVQNTILKWRIEMQEAIEFECQTFEGMIKMPEQCHSRNYRSKLSRVDETIYLFSK